jgi:homoserine dehydrogenase
VVRESPERGDVDAEEIARLLQRDRASSEPLSPKIFESLIYPRGAAVLVDATAAEPSVITPLYQAALERGIHVVTANKKPLAGRPTVDVSRAKPGTYFRYEATVGAGLPVIETLKSLLRTGDRVRRIDCVLSGTLAFLSNAIANDIPLSEAFKTARSRGFTEPDAREDLRGADVARKAVILARELGADIETQDVDLEPFLPIDVVERLTQDNLDQEIQKLDATFAARATQLRKKNEKLVYLARIDVTGDGEVKAVARPIAVPLAHPAAQLQESSALVAFTTDRYSTDPLVLSGSGAGGAVTASAILADVFNVTGHS